MPKIKLPNSAGDWTMMDESHQAQLWRRIMDHPAGGKVTMYAVGSENTPEVLWSENLATARENFARFQLLKQ